MKIPHEKISPDALHALVEEFINRSGTDYGVVEASLEEKVEDVMAQLQVSEVHVVFDAASESASLMTTAEADLVEQQLAAAYEEEETNQASVSKPVMNQAFDEYSQELPFDDDFS